MSLRTLHHIPIHGQRLARDSLPGELLGPRKSLGPKRLVEPGIVQHANKRIGDLLGGTWIDQHGRVAGNLGK